MSNIQQIYAKQHPSYWVFTLIGLILPMIGFILGIIYLSKADLLDRKVGEHTLVMSIIGSFLGYIWISYILTGTF